MAKTCGWNVAGWTRVDNDQRLTRGDRRRPSRPRTTDMGENRPSVGMCTPYGSDRPPGNVRDGSTRTHQLEGSSCLRSDDIP